MVRGQGRRETGVPFSFTRTGDPPARPAADGSGDGAESAAEHLEDIVPKLARGTRWSVTVAALMAAAAVSLSACNPLSYGCHRQGSHGAVVCIGTNHDPSA